ncbi:hypothetical protein CSC02_5212 (plasmid) [Enterobacter hormaechei subsp. hoffmannii]|nr:hypothetical protein CSC02_5212 [Enterobacter hormaechei subsp. hoffmannii]
MGNTHICVRKRKGLKIFIQKLPGRLSGDISFSGQKAVNKSFSFYPRQHEEWHCCK